MRSVRFRIASLAVAAILFALAAACRTSRPIVPRGPKGRTTVGVVLPLSGKFRALGEGARDAIWLARDGRKGLRSAARLIVRDSKGTAEGAAQAVDELVTQEDAATIVGPLFRSESAGAAERAQKLGVPLVSLSNDEDVVGAGSYAFSIGFSEENEMADLVAYAMGEGGMKRFSVLHPQMAYGENMLAAFRREVEGRGGEIVSVESYEEGQTTFTEPVRRLVGLEDPTNRPEFREAARKCARAKDGFRRARCRKEALKTVPPVIEFDGLFVPDSHRTVALIALAVIAEDVVVERDPKRLKRIERTLKRRVEPITLLGTSAWNAAALPKKAGRAVENALFADGYFAGARTGATRTFVAAFRRKFGRDPKHHEALAFDAIRWVAQALELEEPKTTNELRAALRGQFEGVSGRLSFEDSTRVRRQLRILTIRNGRITEVPRAPPHEGS